MSTLAVISYPQENTAGEAAAKLAQMQKEYLITLEDIAWVTKKPDGRMKLHQGTGPTGVGAGSGAFWGFLFGYGAAGDEGPAWAPHAAGWRPRAASSASRPRTSTRPPTSSRAARPPLSSSWSTSGRSGSRRPCATRGAP
jgi:hypothetical protein